MIEKYTQLIEEDPHNEYISSMEDLITKLQAYVQDTNEQENEKKKDHPNN